MFGCPLQLSMLYRIWQRDLKKRTPLSQGKDLWLTYPKKYLSEPCSFDLVDRNVIVMMMEVEDEASFDK